MSDSTKLTFVRCPSCRSLVPAMSTRCRMCGASLDSSDAGSIEDQAPKSSRVRQRTISQPDSELTKAAGRIRAEGHTTVDEDEAGKTDGFEYTNHEDLHQEDPLGAYIEEMDAEEHESEEGDFDLLAEDREGKDVDEQEDIFGSNQWEEEAASEYEEVEDEPDIFAEQDDDIFSPTAEPEAPTGREPTQAGFVEEVESEAPRVVVESGGRRAGGRSRLSFGRPEGELQERRVQPPQMREHSVQKPLPAEKPAPEKKPAAETQAPTAPDQPMEAYDRLGETGVASEEERGSPERTRIGSAKRAEEDLAGGRLFGWLVSYADPDGAATELREGKLFVTRTSLKKSDIIIEDNSISTPHALVSVGMDSGLQVQDLMSDGGVFIRRRGEQEFVREERALRVEHGDMIRFGGVEFTVALIAHVGQK